MAPRNSRPYRVKDWSLVLLYLSSLSPFHDPSLLSASGKEVAACEKACHTPRTSVTRTAGCVCGSPAHAATLYMYDEKPTCFAPSTTLILYLL